MKIFFVLVCCHWREPFFPSMPCSRWHTVQCSPSLGYPSGKDDSSWSESSRGTSLKGGLTGTPSSSDSSNELASDSELEGSKSETWFSPGSLISCARLT